MTIMYFCFYSSPLIASCGLMLMYYFFYPEKLDTDNAYIIIMIMSNLQGPFVILYQSLYETQFFLSSWSSLNAMFKKIDDQVLPNIQSTEVELGEIHYYKASFSINDGTVNSIYNEIMTQKPHVRRN